MENLSKRETIAILIDAFVWDGVAEFKKDLQDLRRMCFGVVGNDNSLSASEFSKKMFVLNYLIEDAEYIEKKEDKL